MLRAGLTTDAAIAALRDRWITSDRCIRIENILEPALTEELREAVREQPHTLMSRATLDISFQYWAYAFTPEADCDHVMCRFGRWLFGDGSAWLSKVTDMDLVRSRDNLVVATHYTKGSHLGVHNDFDGKRRVAFVFGLTPPEQHLPVPDGHLDFLAVDDGGVHMRERRAPGWNTLDVFDVTGTARLHRINIVRTHAERRAFTGWLY